MGEPTAITVSPCVPALEESRGTFELLIADLEREGFNPTLGYPLPPAGGDVSAFPMELVLSVGEAVKDEAIGVLVGLALARLRNARGRHRPRPTQLIIYGPNHEVLRRVEVPPTTGEADDLEDGDEDARGGGCRSDA